MSQPLPAPTQPPKPHASDPICCPVCGNHFRAQPSPQCPCSLDPCGHVVCTACLNGDGSSPAPSCPVCHDSVSNHINNDGLGAYAEEVFARLQLEDAVCENCLSEVDTGFATDVVPGPRQPCTDTCHSCGDKPVCARHAITHRGMGHEIANRADSASDPSPTSVCDKHGGIPFDHYCMTDGALVCPQCAMIEHPSPGHDVNTVSGAAYSLTEQVRRLSKQCRHGSETARIQCEKVNGVKKLLETRVKASQTAFEHSITSLITALQAHQQSVVKQLQDMHHARVKALDAQVDVLIVAFGQLKAAVGLCESVLSTASTPPVDLQHVVTASTSMLHQFHPVVIPATSPLLEVVSNDAALREALANMTWFRDSIDANASSLSGPGLSSFSLYDPTDAASTRCTFSVTCCDVKGEPIAHIAPDDIRIQLETLEPHGHTGNPGSVRSILPSHDEPGQLDVTYTITDKDVKAVLIHATVMGSNGANIKGSPIAVERQCVAEGYHVSTFPVEAGEKYGLAVAPDESCMVVTYEKTSEVHVYSLPDGQLLSKLGGQGTKPGQFHQPCRTCFAYDGSSFLVTDYINYRVQEFSCQSSEDGLQVEFMRQFPVTEPRGIACSAAMVAVGTSRDGGCNIQLFDYNTGALVTEFGKHGTGQGELSECFGLRFSRAGDQIIAAEVVTGRVSVFSIRGEFLTSFGTGLLGIGHKDVALGSGGSVIVTDSNNHRVCVFVKGECVRRFGNKGAADGLFTFPTALAVAGRRLYVLDYGTPRVQVFE